ALSVNGQFRLTKAVHQAEGTENQTEVDDPPQLGQGSGQHHRRAEPGAAWLHQLLQGCQLYAGNEAVDGVATQAFTLRTGETVEDAIAPAPATETAGPAPAVQVDPDARLAQC